MKIILFLIFMLLASFPAWGNELCTDLTDCQIKLLQARNDNIKLQVQLWQLQGQAMTANNNEQIKKLKDSQGEKAKGKPD